MVTNMNVFFLDVRMVILLGLFLDDPSVCHCLCHGCSVVSRPDTVACASRSAIKDNKGTFMY